MNVEIWIRNDFARPLEPAPVKHTLVFSYDDSSGLSGAALAERVWTMLSGLAPHRLNEEDQQVQAAFEAVAHGRMLSAGDVVVIENRRYVCRPDGWDEFTN